MTRSSESRYCYRGALHMSGLVELLADTALQLCIIPRSQVSDDTVIVEQHMLYTNGGVSHMRHMISSYRLFMDLVRAL